MVPFGIVDTDRQNANLGARSRRLKARPAAGRCRDRSRMFTVRKYLAPPAYGMLGTRKASERHAFEASVSLDESAR